MSYVPLMRLWSIFFCKKNWCILHTHFATFQMIELRKFGIVMMIAVGE